jgi:hypothetical protein
MGGLFLAAAIFTIAILVIAFVDFIIEGWLLLRPPGSLAITLFYTLSASVAVTFFFVFLALVELVI